MKENENFNVLGASTHVSIDQIYENTRVKAIRSNHSNMREKMERNSGENYIILYLIKIKWISRILHFTTVIPCVCLIGKTIL